MPQLLITDEARAFVGVDVPLGTGIVSRREFQRWAAALDDWNPLYFDDEFAREYGYREAVAPALFIGCVTRSPVALGSLRPDGLPAQPSSGMVPLPYTPRYMAGGDVWEFLASAYDGDRITASRRIVALEQKEGRSGPFVIITGRTSYVNQDNVTIALCTDTILARK
ncbi:MaoC family dehydratase N-terminal domain-containing protein [Dactylosporangium sp. NPDC005572]|uniref:FAS1-like dehydratase domain-containing protein n=1 Tax=Dactylosporangium sp. NPDC005572 TaxID=3156889 RepID=UPI0033B8531F